MATPIDNIIQEQLQDLRQNLEEAIKASREEEKYLQLIREVDSALERVNKGTFGLCKACNETIEMERLISDPLIQYCLDHLTPTQKNALEEDLQLAFEIQKALLPPQNLRSANWEISYHYEGASPISGDYCDLINVNDKKLYFVIGDVTGKGVASSMLMAHLHATFRALNSLNLPLDQLMARANRAFCESSLPAYFATLVCGAASDSGEIEICNAGHPPPLLIKQGRISMIKSTGIPIGMFCDEQYRTSKMQLSPGDTILLYTDGLTESKNASGSEYGGDRLSEFVKDHYQLPPNELISNCIDDVRKFMAGKLKTDDLTIMVIQHSRNLD